MLAWIDVETTGLDEKVDQLLEVAMVVTNDDLDEIVAFTSPVFYDKTEMQPLRQLMSPEVEKMHMENGLLADILSGNSLGYIQHNLNEIYDYYVAVPVPLAGSTISFDRKFLTRSLPLLANRLHYRNIDVSTLKELNIRWQFAPPWFVAKKHRALDDIRDSIDELKFYRRHLNVRTGDTTSMVGPHS